MASIPLVELVSTLTLDNSKVLTALREVEAARKTALSGDNSDALERALQGLATAAKEANARLDPLAKQAQLTLREMQNLANAVKAGAAEIQSSLQRYRELEAILKGQVAVLDKAGAGYLGIAKDMKSAGEEGKRLEALNKSLTASYKTEDLTRYGRGLLDIVQAQKAGVTSQTQAISQLKSYQSALAQQTGALEKNSAEYKSVIKAMGDTGTAIRKLEADADKLSASFRSDELSRYAGEFKQIDAAVKSGTDGFENASTRVQKLSAELKEQQAALTNTGREFDQFSRLLKEAAAQQERYQAAAEQAARANDAAQIRTYGSELKQLEGTLRNTTAELGRLDSQQRALKYDSGAVSQYRGEQERLQGSFDGLGRGLEGLRGKLQDYARGLSEGSSEHKELVRVMDATERATQTLTREQERAAQAYRGAEIEQFTARLRDVDRAQRDNLTSTEQAARAVQQIQTEFKEYAAALGIAERELGTFARSQLDAGRGADTFASAQERAARAFDASALRSFVSELQSAVQAYEKGATGAEGFTRAVSDSQGRLREYASTLNQNSREFADFNKLLDISERALTEVGTTAERASRAFDAGPVRVYSTELKDLQGTGRELGTAFSGIEGELNQLDASLRDSGQAANLSARELTALQNVERELEGATTRLAAEQSKLEAAFRVDALKTFRSDLEQIVTANKNGVTSFDQTARAIDALQGRMREFGNSTTLSANEQRTLATVMGQTETAATRLATSAERAGNALVSDNIRQQVTALKDLELAYERGDISQEQFMGSAKEIGVALNSGRDSVDRSTRAYEQYTDALRRVEVSSFKAGAGVRTFGTFAGVTAGIGDQLQNVLYRLGPAGEAVGVAMYSASAGMAGATVSAKALNIAMTVGVVGAVIGAAVAAKALVDRAYELDTGMTDVAKTTGFTGDQLLQLESRLQDIAVATGTGVTELLDYAAVAGQLGIKGVDDIAGFVDVMNKLAIATDIVGQEGAEQMAQFVVVTKEANVSVGDSAETVANVINKLGNDLATTEQPILNMAQRLIGLSTTADVSQVDILGLAGALTALGINAEAGGTATTQIFAKIVTAVNAGGAELDKFAQVAGLTSDEFARLVKENPTDAFYALVGGMKASKNEGGSLLGIYDDLGFSGERQRLVLSSLVGGYDIFGLSLRTARQEAEDMTALNAELATRLSSLEGVTNLVSQGFQRVGNELAIAMIPKLKEGLTSTLDFIRGLTGLEQTGDRTQTFATKAGSAIGQFATALVTGENQSNTFAAGVGAAFGDTYRVVDSAVGIVRTSILTIFGGALTAGVEAVKSFTANISQNLGGSSSAIGTIFSNVGQIVQNTVQFIGETLGRIPTFYSAMITASGELSNSVSRVFIGVGDVLKGFGFILYGSVVEPFVNMLAPIRAAATNVLLTVQNFIVGAAQRFEPLLNFLGKVGIDIAGFLTDTTEQAVSKITGFLSKGVSEYQGAGALYTGTNESIKTGFELIGLGVSGAANAVGDGTNAMTRALQSTEETLGTSVKAGDELAATNTKLGQDSEAAGAGVAVLGDESEGATGGVVDLGAAAEETGRTVGEMAQAIVESFQRGEISSTTAINALTAKLAELKQQKADALASGDYDAADLQKFDEDIAAVQARLTEATTAAANFRDGVTEYDNAQREANKSIQAVSTIFAQQRVLIEQLGWSTAAQNVNLYADAQDAAEAATRANMDAAFAQEAAQRDLNKTIADGLTVFHQQTAVLEQLGLAIITDETNALAAAQAEAARAAAESSDSWRVLKETQDGYASSTSLTVSQTNTLAEVMGTVRNSLQEAENAFTITGNAVTLNADKTALYQAALETLHRAGIDPATVGLQGWVTVLQESQDKTQAQAEANERYTENLKTTRDAQEALGDASSIATEDIAGLITSLDKAAEGTGKLGADARQAQEDLRALALARELAGMFDEIGAAADRALAEIPGLSDQARGGLQALSDASKEMSKALSDGVVTPSEGIKVLGAGIDALAEGFRDDLSPAAYAAVKAIDDIAMVAVKAASGDYIGAAIAALGGLINAFIDFVSESKRETLALTESLTAAMDALDQSIDNTIENMRRAADNDVATGALDELSGNIIQVQLDLIENQRQVNIDLAESLAERRTALEGINDPEQRERINTEFDALDSTIREGGRLTSDAIIQTGLENALAAGQSADEFINGLIDGTSGVAGQLANAGFDISIAVGHYIDSVGGDLENAGAELAAAAAEALDGMISEFDNATDQWENSLLDSRIRLAKAQGASDIEILILETNAKILDAHQSFMDDMSDLETDKEEIIRAYILANPGISREEAEAYAESIVGPGRDALEENYANTSAAILLESQTQAEELGLSEREYWKAVIEGNSEVLGDMTEQQRLALLDFIATAREYGIELPGYLEDMYNEVHGAHETGGAYVAEGAEQGNAEHLATLENVFSQLRSLLGPAADDIIALIQETYDGQAVAHEDGGAAVASGAEQGNAQHLAALDNIYSQLRSLLGPAADEIIGLIQETYDGQAAAHIDGGAEAGAGAEQGADNAASGIDNGAQTETDALNDAETAIRDAIGLRFSGPAEEYTLGYAAVGDAQADGSRDFVGGIQDAAQAEEGEFQARSQDLVRAIEGAKGAEREKLIAEYNNLQREHEAASRARQTDIGAQGRDEATALKGAFEDNASAAVAGGKVAAGGTKQAYDDLKNATTTAGGLFGGILGDQKTTLAEKQRLLFDEQKDVMIARRDVLRVVTVQSYQMMAQANSHGSISVLAPAITASGNRVVDAIISAHEKIRRAIEDQTAKTRAAIRAQSAVLASAPSPGASGYAGEAPTISPVDFTPSIGAFAADAYAALPDYSYATGGVTAYAAATSSLLDLFGVSRSIQLNSTQERALSLNVTFSGLKDSFAAPVGLMNRAADLMWSTAKFERDTAIMNRETIQKMGTTTASGTLEWSRRPRRR